MADLASLSQEALIGVLHPRRAVFGIFITRVADEKRCFSMSGLFYV
jgi:hypothetical protein